MKTRIPGFKSFLYCEVWEIVKMKDGCVFKTTSTGRYIKSSQEAELNTKYVASSLSTSLSRQAFFEIDLVDVTYFK